MANSEFSQLTVIAAKLSGTHRGRAPEGAARELVRGAMEGWFPVLRRNPRIRSRLLLLLLPFLIASCAHVRIYPLDADGKIRAGEQEGARYYLPKPYLIVAEVPVDPQVSTHDEAGGHHKIWMSSGGTGQPKEAKPDDSGDTDSSDSAADDSSGAPGGTTDTSFGMMTKQYGIKLIYLPDLSHPMAITESTGLFGTATMKPTLQDGWMLTELDAETDSKTAETLAAVGSLLGGGSSGSDASGSSGAASAAKLAMMHAFMNEGMAPESAKQLVQSPTGPPVLKPGLYELHYNQKGMLDGISAVACFGQPGGLTTPVVAGGIGHCAN